MAPPLTEQRPLRPPAGREKFGGDAIEDVRAALEHYRGRIGWSR